MSITTETLAILVFLIPGFLSSLVLNIVLVRKRKENLPLIIEALSFSFIIYVLSSCITSASPFQVVSAVSNGVPSYKMVCNWRGALPVLILSLALPLLAGWLVTKDLHMKVLRFLHVTDKTARGTIWQDVFTDQKRYIIVNLSGGRRVFGWPMYFSDTPEEGQIYLQDPAWITEEGRYQDLDIHGLFLVKSQDIESVEFTNVTQGDAKQERRGENGTRGQE